MIKIRGYIDADYEQVKQNLEEANTFNPQLDTRQSLRRTIKQAPGSILVAVDTSFCQSVVGNVYVIEHPWNSFLFRLTVKPRYREQGIATLLIDKAKERLERRGNQ